MTCSTRLGGVQLRHGALPRSPGLHASTILRSIALQIGTLKPDDEEEELDADNEDLPVAAVRRMAAGLAWESWYGPQVCDIYPAGEYFLEGICCTPDGIRFDCDPLRVVEIKYTWRSSAKPVEQHWMWVKQLQIYCHVLGTCHGELHAYHSQGDYRGSGPLPLVHEFEFEPVELERIWAMLVAQAQRLGK